MILYASGRSHLDLQLEKGDVNCGTSTYMTSQLQQVPFIVVLSSGALNLGANVNWAQRHTRGSAMRRYSTGCVSPSQWCIGLGNPSNMTTGYMELT